MRNRIRSGIIGCSLLLLVGAGWYIKNSNEVNDWIRSLGRKTPLAADEVEVKQRTSAALPGLDGAVQVRVGDIKRGKTADVEIIGSDSVTLATLEGAEIGERIAFTHDDKKYEVEVIRYVDKFGSGDFATFRIIPLPSDTKVTEPGASVQPVEPDGNIDKPREPKK